MNYTVIVPNFDVMGTLSAAMDHSEKCRLRSASVPHPVPACRHGLCSDPPHESRAWPLVGVRGGVVNLLVTGQTSSVSLAEHFFFLSGPVHFSRIRILVFVSFGSVVARVELLLGFLFTSDFLLHFPVRQSFTCFVACFNVASEGASSCSLGAASPGQTIQHATPFCGLGWSRVHTVCPSATALTVWPYGPSHPPRTAQSGRQPDS